MHETPKMNCRGNASFSISNLFEEYKQIEKATNHLKSLVWCCALIETTSLCKVFKSNEMDLLQSTLHSPMCQECNCFNAVGKARYLLTKMATLLVL